ncbi:MAG: M20/M25/M40 family metallo-hydrolase [Bdellovibrionaceae bacterium]|nr:M20/M25/M40 family metallo-hydrolase [Pseudobdellovibrionaceae bacterium]
MEFVQSCREFISIDSTPTQGSRKAAEFAAKFCRSLGLHVEEQIESSPLGEEANIIVRHQAERQDLELLLQNHLDTVDPGPFHLWSVTGNNPFDATIVDNKIYGLGAADVKLDFLCKARAMAAVAGHKSKFKLAPVLVGTFGEETGMTGCLKLIRKNRINPKFALIGEPTNLRLANAAKGFVSVEIIIPFAQEEIKYRNDHNLRESTSTQSKVFHGVSAHSSHPHLGDSAILKMLSYLEMVPESVAIMEIDGGTNYNTVPSHAFLELDFTSVENPVNSKIKSIYKAIKQLESEFRNHTDTGYSPEYPTLNIGLIRTHADHILMSGSCRILPSITQEVFEKWMDFLRQSCSQNGSQFRITDYKKPFSSSESSIFTKGCRDILNDMNLPSNLTSLSSTNESSLIARLKVDCLCFGPGLRENNIHTPNEHVSVDDLEKATVFYTKVIERFCL